MAALTFTPDELESMFVWDCICEAIPLTREERREIDSRDREIKSLALASSNTQTSHHKLRCEMTPEELEAERAADRERKRAKPRTAAQKAEQRDRSREYYRLHRKEILAKYHASKKAVTS